MTSTSIKQKNIHKHTLGLEEQDEWEILDLQLHFSMTETKI